MLHGIVCLGCRSYEEWRMAETAALLVDEVLPRQPVRVSASHSTGGES